MKKISVYAGVFIKILFGLLIFYIWIKSIFLSAVTDIHEANHINKDKWWIHIILLLVFIAAVSLLQYKAIRFHPKTYVLLLAGGMIAGIIWIAMTQIIPTVDQGDLVRIASDLIEHINEEFHQYGYMQRYPHQRTIVLIYYLLFQIAGKNNFLLMQLLNVFFLAVVMVYVGRIFKQLFPDSDRTSILLGMVLCIPFNMYIAFVYGTIMSLMFAVMAIYYCLCCLEHFSWKHSLLAAFFSMLSVCAKANALIFVVAIIVMLLLDMMTDFRPVKLILPIIIIVVYAMGMKAIDIGFESISGVPISKGVPQSGYIVMGLSNDSYRGPGWFNGYVMSKYNELECDYNKSNTVMQEELKDILKDKIRHPKEFISFLYQKNATQWNNPTFQCFWIYTICESRVEQSGLVKSALSGNVNNLLVKLCNVLQSLSLMGVVLFLFLRSRLSGKQLIFAIVFIGGFLFHSFWEAKGQYTVVYYFIIFPYAVLGYHDIAIRVNKAWIKYFRKRNAISARSEKEL